MNRRDALKSIFALPVVGPAVVKGLAVPSTYRYKPTAWYAPDGSASPPIYSWAPSPSQLPELTRIRMEVR